MEIVKINRQGPSKGRRLREVKVNKLRQERKYIYILNSRVHMLNELVAHAA